LIAGITYNVLLKVMAGDQLSATTQYYYQNAVTNTTGNNLTSSIVTALVQSILGSPATGLAKGNTTNISTQLNANTAFNTATAPDASNATGTNPKAYMTIVFFDERFNFVSEGSTALRVNQQGDNAAPLVLANIKAPKNGFAYIYLSNESNEPVYFDNFTVSDNRGRIIEENHYYAFGLKIAGISSVKLGDVNEGSLKNNYQYQGDFSEMDEDIGWNDFELRNYDAQVGRWVQQDPFHEFIDLYSDMGNDPISNIDPGGGWAATGLFEGMSRAGIVATTTLGGAIVGTAVDLLSGGDGGKGLLIGAGAGLASNFGIGNFASASLTTGGDILSHGVKDAEIKSAINPNARYVGNQQTPAAKPNLPFTDDQFNKVYNDGQPYSYKPCDEPIENGKPPYNQCAIRFSKAIMDLGVSMSDCAGPRCKHGYLRVINVIDFLKNHYNYIELSNPKRSPFPGIFYKALSEATGHSSIVVMMNLIEGNATGNHIEFLYKGMQKSPFINTWETANKFYIFEFSK
jgi:RHS repeat-associated protein